MVTQQEKQKQQGSTTILKKKGGSLIREQHHKDMHVNHLCYDATSRQDLGLRWLLDYLSEIQEFFKV